MLNSISGAPTQTSTTVDRRSQRIFKYRSKRRMRSDCLIKSFNVPEGLFGVPLTWMLEILPYINDKNLHPIWEIHTIRYGNLFPQILENIYDARIGISKPRYDMMEIKRSKSYSYNETEFQLAHNLFFKYFRIAKGINVEVDKVAQKFREKTLGVHYRGTDKMGDEASLVTKEDFIKQVNGFLNSNQEYNTIFIATDEEEFVNVVNKNFIEKPKYLIIVNDFRRSKTSQAIHKSENVTVNDPLEKGKEAMIDSLLLSRCDYVIKTASFLSAWAKIWNPSLEIYNVNNFYNPWFPDHHIPVNNYC